MQRESTRTFPLFFVIVVLGVLPGCAGSNNKAVTNGMEYIKEWYSRVAPGHEPPPPWVFCLPEKKGTIYALGYALQNLAGQDATRQAAFENAVHNLARSIKVSVKAREYMQTEDSGLAENGQLLLDKEEQVDSKIEQLVEDKAQLIEEWQDMSNGVFYVLSAVSASEIKALKAVASVGLECKIGKRPSWVDNPPRLRGMLFAVGQARMAFNPAKSYSEAEERALVELAKQIRSQVTGFEDMEDSRAGDSDVKDYTYKIVRIATQEKLSGTDILARWVDFKTGAAFALARMPLVSVKKRILAAAMQVEKQEKIKESKDGKIEQDTANQIEKKAEAALDMMEKALQKREKEKHEQIENKPDTKDHNNPDENSPKSIDPEEDPEDSRSD
ncbi:MAG: hypothetical protein GXP49_10075 [Deltaproteobacteria bacterium]|nr:hypothetical protein [Deltaproteobacteria bacterium]